MPQGTPGAKSVEDISDSLSSNSFSEVLNSVQGLQQVVQTLSLEEILEMDEKAILLVQQLGSLQSLLANLHTAKRFVTAVNAFLSGASGHGKIDGNTETAARTEDTKAPSNVIHFPGEAKNVQEQAKAISRELDKLGKENSFPAHESVSQTHMSPLTGEDSPVQSGDFTLGAGPVKTTEFELGDVALVSEASAGQAHHIEATISSAATESQTASSPKPPAETAITATKEGIKTVPPRFFDMMRERLTEYVGPMATIIVQDQVTALGESLALFPHPRLEELIELVSHEISASKLRIAFQRQISEDMRRFEL